MPDAARHCAVSGVVIDPNNQVVDGVAEAKKTTSEDAPIFLVAPNPNQGSFSFRLLDVAGEKTFEGVEVEVFNVAGQVVYRGRYEVCLPYMDYRIQMEHPVSGLYYVRFRSGNRVEMKKMLVE